MSKHTPAEKAIRNFDFDDYGMGGVDPKSEYAEWVPELAARVEAAVREQVAKEIEAYKVDHHPTGVPAHIAWEAGRERAASIARRPGYSHTAA